MGKYSLKFYIKLKIFYVSFVEWKKLNHALGLNFIFLNYH